MIKKDKRRQQAVKRDKRKKIIIAALCVVVVAAIAAVVVINTYQNRDSRVFSDGDQLLTLHADGTFNFSETLHGNRKSGRYTETDTDGVIVV